MSRSSATLFYFCRIKYLIDLNRFVLNVKVGIYQEDGTDRLKVNEESIVFGNNTMHTRFLHALLYLNGKLISHSNICYLHSAFIEPELTTDSEAKHTWAKRQGYNYLAKSSKQCDLPSAFYAEFDQQKEHTMQLCGALSIDSSDCEKFLVPGVTVHLRLYRSPTYTLLSLNGSNDEAKALAGKVQGNIEKSFLFVRKAVVADSVKLSIEKALVESAAI